MKINCGIENTNKHVLVFSVSEQLHRGSNYSRPPDPRIHVHDCMRVIFCTYGLSPACMHIRVRFIPNTSCTMEHKDSGFDLHDHTTNQTYVFIAVKAMKPHAPGTTVNEVYAVVQRRRTFLSQRLCMKSHCA